MAPRPKMVMESAEATTASAGEDNTKKYDSESENEESSSLEYHKDDLRMPNATETSSQKFQLKRWWLLLPSQQNVHPTQSLPLLVFLDMFAVSLVVPLLFQYFKQAGVNSAKQREFLSSLFSTSQIAGGLLMGMLSDHLVVFPRTLLFLSFAGSALSYALIAYGGLSALILSRLTVGLVKQTMTVTTTLMTNSTTPGRDRVKYMGRLTAASTVAWIVGPAAGAFLFKYVHVRAPPLLACALFLLSWALAAVWLSPESSSVRQQQQPATTTKTTTATRSMWSNLKSCFTSQALGSVVLVRLLLTWVTKTTNYSQLGNYYEEMYGLETHQRGYLTSYQQCLQFFVQSSLVAVVLRWSGGERRTVCFFTALWAIVVLLETLQSLSVFLIVVCPLKALCFAMTHLSLQSLLTHVAPKSSTLTVLAAVDVLQNAVSVSVPFYRAALFRLLKSSSTATAQYDDDDNNNNNTINSSDDPDPIAWIWSSGLHWLIVAAVTASLLLQTTPRRGEKTRAGMNTATTRYSSKEKEQ